MPAVESLSVAFTYKLIEYSTIKPFSHTFIALLRPTDKRKETNDAHERIKN
jgi:hypothetical protein